MQRSWQFDQSILFTRNEKKIVTKKLFVFVFTQSSHLSSGVNT